jgi:hypothetical protein
MCNNQFNISRSKGVVRLKTFEDYFFLEEKLDAEDREKIKEDDWGIIIKDKDGNITEKAYPMPDAQHVISAARMYPFAKRKYDAKVVAELRRKIIAKAKEYNVPDSRIQSVIDDVPGGKSKPVKESVGPEDDTSGTSEFDESIDNDPDDCYTESDIFITEADKRFLSELKKKNDQLSKFELNRYGKTLIKNSSSGNLIIMLPPQPEKPSDKHVWEYFMMLIEPLRKYRNAIRYGSFNAIKWYKYDKCIRKFFNAIGLPYKDDRILCNIKVSPKGTKLLFKRHEYKTYHFNPSTYVLIHQSPKNNLTLLRPTHCSKDGVIYPKPRVYAVMRKLSNTSAFGYGISGGDFGDNFYVLDCKPMEVYHDMEYGAPTKESGDNTAVFINTTKPIKVIPLEQFMKTEHTSEAYDAITGEEIPIDHAYTMDEMREITLSFTEDVKPGKLMKVSPPDSKYVYFSSPENYMPEMKLNRPLFVTPYKSIASIFISRDMELQNRIPRGSYNCQYEEWLKFNKKESGRCLKDVHVYIEGYPDLEPYEIKQTGYVHQILTHNWNDNYYRYPWMDASKEWLIVNDNGNVEFDDVTECEITYHISGKPGWKGLGPRQDALESFVRKSIKLIHDKYKKDQKDPIGNQNCLLCTWCFEARMRGLDALPRPVYSPRDDVLDIPGNQIVFGSRQIKFKNYTDLASEITKAGDGCRFYVHVNWKDSKGGHEFIIMRIGGKNFIIDPQQGKMEPLTKSHNYVSDINYDNSYIVQLSGKKFNRNLFDKWNDESTVLLWDPKRDIPYMLKEGMITKEEAEKELRKSSTERFTSELKRELKNNPVQESWNTEESLKLFKKLPKDLQEFLKNGDISDLDEDYGIDGYVVEEFSAPEYLEIAGKSYNLKDDDPMYNAIDFATDGGGNDFVYNPDDGYYYNLDHEDYDIYDHIHGDRLSSTKWSELIDSNRKSNKSSNPNVERSHEFGIMTESHLYWDICHVVLDDEIDTKLCNKIIDDYNVARKGTWHDEFFKKVDEFANKYDCSYIKAPVDEFKSFMKRDFRPTMFNWKFNIDGLKPRCMDIIKAFMKVIKELDIDTTKLFPPAYKLHKQIIAKYGTKMFQEGVIQNIKNKTSPFEKNLVYHISPEGHLDGQVFKPRVPEYLDKYDPSKTEFEDVETPRVCFSPSIEGCLNAIIVNIGRWKTANKLRDWYVYIPEKPLKEYKYRTNKQLVDEKKVYDANITKEIWIEEPVRLKQYGIIRIDSVTDKSRKKAVPTTLGESKKRNVYDFKWHWLVKPKVLKDVPYDYSPLEVCKDMVADLERYKYGIPENGKIVKGSSKDYDTKWKLQSPEEFEKNGGGICFDFVEFEEGYLDAYGIKCKKYYMSTNLPDGDCHTFIIVDDNKGGLVYPESSFDAMAGTHQAKSKEEIFKMVANGFWKMNDNANKFNEIKYYVWEYNGHPKYGSNIKQCMEYYSKGEPIFEAYTLKPGKSKSIKESYSPIHEFVNNFRNQGGHING